MGRRGVVSPGQTPSDCGPVMRSLSGPRRVADLAVVLVGRDLRVSYGHALLGLIWAPLAALVQVLVLGFVFVRVLPLGVDDYAVFVFTGVTVWQIALVALIGGAEAFTGNRDLVRRPGFPTAVLPFTTIGSALAGYALSLPVLLVAAALADRLTVAALAIPLVLAVEVLVLAGPVLLVATLNVRFRDVRHLVALLLGVAFYATPVFYAADRIPQRHRWVADYNPLALVVRLHRSALYDGAWPDAAILLRCTLIGVGGALLGYAVFRRFESHLADDL
jgi:lipopolysaccharide transport system permease protein